MQRIKLFLNPRLSAGNHSNAWFGAEVHSGQSNRGSELMGPLLEPGENEWAATFRSSLGLRTRIAFTNTCELIEHHFLETPCAKPPRLGQEPPFSRRTASRQTRSRSSGEGRCEGGGTQFGSTVRPLLGAIRSFAS